MAEAAKDGDKGAVRGLVVEEIEQAAVKARRDGALTVYGMNRGYVAFLPARAFGRVMFAATMELNDVLRELELASVADASDMDLSVWQEYHRAVDDQLKVIRGAVGKMKELSQFGIRGDYKEGIKFAKSSQGRETGVVENQRG